MTLIFSVSKDTLEFDLITIVRGKIFTPLLLNKFTPLISDYQ